MVAGLSTFNNPVEGYTINAFLAAAACSAKMLCPKDHVNEDEPQIFCLGH
jgi:hypothetical protein